MFGWPAFQFRSSPPEFGRGAKAQHHKFIVETTHIVIMAGNALLEYVEEEDDPDLYWHHVEDE